MTPHALAIRDLSHRYADGRVALDGLSFAVDAGGCVAIVGPNGAGKTTLFNLVSGVTPPDAGTVTFEGRLWTLPARVYSARMHVVPGESLDAESLVGRLDRCGYARVDAAPIRPGQYRRRGRSRTHRSA